MLDSVCLIHVLYSTAKDIIRLLSQLVAHHSEPKCCYAVPRETPSVEPLNKHRLRKLGSSPPISRYILEIVKDRPIVAV